MITGPSVDSGAIRRHYNWLTPFYRLLWGIHIHHGLWEDDEDSRTAQIQLIEHLASAADVADRARVIDVGCGLGGSSIHLAKTRQCQVTGLTISRVQRLWAQAAALRAGVSRQTEFLCQDAEAFCPQAPFEILWSIECTEHLFDKPAFFRRAAQWLRPGGQLAICAWLAADEPHTPEIVQKNERVCEAFLCPSLGTQADYVNWLEEAGFEIQQIEDLTQSVSRTWEVCIRRVRNTGAARLSRVFGRKAHEFANSFQVILDAYQTGAMKYASFTARL